MADYKHDVMLTLRIPTELRQRLKEIGAREQRTVSNVAVRAIEMGLKQMEMAGHSAEWAEWRARGEDFERAVLAILETHGLIRAFEKSEPEKKSMKWTGVRSKKLGKKATNG